MVYPGETIRVRAWDGEDQVVVTATVDSHREERDGAPVLSDCVLVRRGLG